VSDNILLVKIEKNVCTLTLKRPEKKNFVTNLTLQVQKDND